GADQSFKVPEKWASELVYHQGWTDEHPRMLADVNGDGAMDVVGFGADGVWTAPSNGSRFVPSLKLGAFGYDVGSWRVARHVRTMGRINNDAMADIVGFGDDGVYTALSTGTGFATPGYNFHGFGYDQGWRVEKHVRLLADVNGDGMDDIVGFGDDGVYLALATASGSFSTPFWAVDGFSSFQGWTPARHVRTTADVNGDGRQDLVGFGDYEVWIALSTGNGFATPQFACPGFGYYNGSWKVDRHERFLADINGDGKDDIVAFGDYGVWTALSTGNGFGPAQLASTGFGTADGWTQPQHPRFVTDLNGDGYPDLVGFGDEAIFRALGGPAGVFTPIQPVLRDLTQPPGYTPYGYRVQPRLVGDVDGDGMPDVVAFTLDDIWVARSSDLPPSPPPRAPSNPRFYSKTHTSLGIQWQDNSNDERQFFVWYYKQSDWAHIRRYSKAANATSDVIAGLDSDTTYCFFVEAENIWGVSEHSSTVCDRTAAAPPPPPPPPPPGIRGVQVVNCEGSPSSDTDPPRTVYVWTMDSTQNVWVERGSVDTHWVDSSCLTNLNPFMFTLEDGHFYLVRVVDPDDWFCGGYNDPTRSGCIAADVGPLRGDPLGIFRRILASN
ncbi:MAG TPA: FG-GAP-like repeat-containing protein, partial [Vicinamibacterales bacterium]|nr:FG-GAP-like repeat-containing protein [Vicinamibacterales bacterium]